MDNQNRIQHSTSSQRIIQANHDHKSNCSFMEISEENLRHQLKSKTRLNPTLRNSKKPLLKNHEEHFPKITDFFNTQNEITRQDTQYDIQQEDEVSKNKMLILSKQKQNLEQKLDQYIKLLEEQEEKNKKQKQIQDELEQELDDQQFKILKTLPQIVFKLEQKIQREQYQKMMDLKKDVGYLRTSTSQKLSDWIDGLQLQRIKSKILNYQQEVKEIEEQKNQLKKDKQNKLISSTNYDIQIHELKHKLTVINKKNDMAKKTLNKYEKQKIEIILLELKFKEVKNCYFSCDNINTGTPAWPLLDDQFKILSLIGKGGFAEVYKAYDILNFRYVACKVQIMNKNWPENARQAFIKYTQRENEVFSNLQHQNIVRYYKTVIVDHYTTCTILEYCEGRDLDQIIKSEKTLSEKYARQITQKLLDVVKYLNTRDRKIIHYDLKPANILFDKYDELKVTDFGLAKIIDNGQSKIKFTSFGCGTFNYLPPECLINQENQMISPKVDIWSIAVIFYYLLYGQKPFSSIGRKSDTNSVQQILKKKIEFPDYPNVSNKSKIFILKCLNTDENERPDIFEAIKIFNNQIQQFNGQQQQFFKLNQQKIKHHKKKIQFLNV